MTENFQIENFYSARVEIRHNIRATFAAAGTALLTAEVISIHYLYFFYQRIRFIQKHVRIDSIGTLSRKRDIWYARSGIHKDQVQNSGFSTARKND